MQFNFSASKLLGVDKDGYCCVNGQLDKGKYGVGKMTFGGGRQSDNLFEIIDRMGQASSKAQGLGATITTADKLFTSDNRLYLRSEADRVIGLLKVGKRKLFIRNDQKHSYSRKKKSQCVGGDFAPFKHTS